MSDLSWFRNRFPYTKLNDINLDWLLKRMKELSALVVSYADDIQRALSQSSTAITQSETAVNSANNAVSIANGAAATADAVSGIAEDARTIASAANNTAIHAETVANDIAETAQSALDTAQSAETIAGNAAQTADDAQTTAQNAVGIANGANTRAGNAEQSALTAISTATAAQQSATTAQQSATAAQQSATAAQQSATAAAGDAQTAQQTAAAAASDAQTAQQAATAAVGDAQTAQQAATAAAGDAQAAQQAATAAVGDAQTAQQAATAAAGDAQAAQQAATTIAINKADIIKNTSSGNVVRVVDGADGLPLESLVVQINPVQEGTGDPSPSNPRPISGWTECNISHSGEDTTSPTVIPITLPLEAGTVYGGVLDVTHGVLTVTYARAEMGTFIWALQDVDHVFRCNLSVRKYGNDSAGIYGLCDSYAFWGNGSLTVVKNNLQNGQFGFQATNSGVFVRNDSCNTVADIETALTDVYLVYPLATPQTYQLTPTEITTLLGYNNFWADCGPLSLEYRADTKLYLQKINTPISNDMVASSRIENNTYFIVGGDLYKSTALILANDSIIPGSNCAHTNLTEALNALYALLT